jgi:hypothetical protein
MANVYDESDVVTIPNNVERQFGLMQLKPETFLAVAGEIKSGFSLDQGQFQALVSGEKVALQRKHLDARSGESKTPIMLAGNTFPLTWTDNSGSLARRVCMFYFGYKPTKTDASLKPYLKTVELPAILRKVNICYRRACELVGKTNIWDSGLLSRHILHQRIQIFTTLNPLCDFIENGDFDICGTNWCPLNHFLESFRAHTIRNCRRQISWTVAVYDTVFKEYNIELKTAFYTWDDSPRVRGKIVTGLVQSAERHKMSVIADLENPEIITDHQDK